MKFFINRVDGQILSYEDDVQVVLDDDFESITEEEVQKILSLRKPPLTSSDFRSAIQRHLDQKAIDLGYDDIKSAVTYAEEPAVPKYQEEGRALRKWRSLVWDYSNEQFRLVESGSREIPTLEGFVGELPELKL